MSEIGRPLTAVELRVLGTLIEKGFTTPEQYPLTQNSTKIGCNQKTARDPTSDYDDGTVGHTLRELRSLGLVIELSPADSRVAKYEQRLGLKLDLRTAAVALLGVLFLRGPQTVSELRTNTMRMHSFVSTEDVEQALEKLAKRDAGALVEKLSRVPGQREQRYIHLVGSVESQLAALEHIRPEKVADSNSLLERLQALEERVSALESARSV
jgi:uncharacterized protein